MSWLPWQQLLLTVFPHKDRMILGYLPGFLAKHESLGNLHGAWVLDSLNLISPDKEESALCPIRTLKQSLCKTKSQDRIPQLSRKVGKNTPLPAPTTSKSLVNAIRMAYPNVFISHYNKRESALNGIVDTL